MNYTTLIAAKTTAGSIKSQVNYSLIESTVVLEEAQTLLYQLLRVREMRTLWTASFAIGASSKALPSDFLDPKGKLRDNKYYEYIQKTEDVLMRSRIYDEDGNLDSGQPCFWAMFDEAVNFDIKFEEARTLYLPYYKKPALLAVTTNETNFLTTRYPHLLRQATNVAAHRFMKNWDGYQAELSILGPMIESINAKDDLSFQAAEYDQEL